MQHYIDLFLNIARDNYIITALGSFVISFVENFLPMIPISLVVTANAYVNGFLLGLLSTWAGSAIGCFSLYKLLKKMEKFNFIKKLKEKHIGSNLGIVSSIRKHCFGWLFFMYMLPVLPTFLITIVSSYADLKNEEFLPPMLFGKFIMMFFLAYVGSDFDSLIKEPKKIVIMILVVIISYVFANRLKEKILLHEVKHRD